LVNGFHASHHAIGRLHGDAAHSSFAQMLLHLEYDVDRRRDREAIADYAQGLVDGRHGRFGKLNVYGGACNLDYVSDIF
jgi:hypothetical protein